MCLKPRARCCCPLLQVLGRASASAMLAEMEAANHKQDMESRLLHAEFKQYQMQKDAEIQSLEARVGQLLDMLGAPGQEGGGRAKRKGQAALQQGGSKAPRALGAGSGGGGGGPKRGMSLATMRRLSFASGSSRPNSVARMMRGAHMPPPSLLSTPHSRATYGMGATMSALHASYLAVPPSGDGTTSGGGGARHRGTAAPPYVTHMSPHMAPSSTAGGTVGSAGQPSGSGASAMSLPESSSIHLPHHGEACHANIL